MVLLVTDHTWLSFMRRTELWLKEHKWDIKMTHAVAVSLGWVDRNHTVVLGIMMVMFLMHLFFSLMLMLGIKCYKRTLLIPWMISHMISIIIMIITFTCWTFMSFFIDLLVAIIFPVMGGLVLGLWIVMWRLVFNYFTVLKNTDMQVLRIFKIQSEAKSIEGHDF